MGRDKLLLLADRRQEAESVRTEADHSYGGDRHEACHGRCRHPDSRPNARLGQHREGQYEPRRQLHTHAGRDGERCPARARVRTGAEQERERQRRQQQRVVVGAADCKHQQHRVQSEEGGRERAGAAEPTRRSGCEADSCEAREGEERFERP